MSKGSDAPAQKTDWDDLGVEQQQNILRLADELAEMEPDKVGRRGVLEVLAGAGIGAALGGGATYGLSQNAAASHGGGSVGTSSNRVDVFAANASVSSAPSASEDVARKNEVDGKADDPHGNSAHSTDMVEDATTTGNGPYEVQKNGTDGTGIINFKT